MVLALNTHARLRAQRCGGRHQSLSALDVKTGKRANIAAGSASNGYFMIDAPGRRRRI